MKLWAFEHTPNIYESEYALISLHTTKQGAEAAKEKYIQGLKESRTADSSDPLFRRGSLVREVVVEGDSAEDYFGTYDDADFGFNLRNFYSNERELIDKGLILPLYIHPKSTDDRVRELEAKYNELIMAVASKFPNETRHETALRYIRNAEAPAVVSCRENRNE